MHVRIVGTGLIGASIGLALSRNGIQVSLSDPSPTSVALAADLGAGRIESVADPELVVVAAPPDVAAAVVIAQLREHPAAIVTDVASVKGQVLDDVLAAAGDDAARYVGSHPMAGRERSGAIAAQADLFEGRSWVVCPHEGSTQAALDAVTALGVQCGAAVTVMSAAEHDEAVAAVSHVPQIAASLVAARLRELPDAAIALSGQGIRDVTRIAASDPMLWTQILAGNAPAVVPVLRELSADLQRVAGAISDLADGASEGPRAVLAQTIADGQLGHSRIPGKHGSAPATYATVVVVVPDEPGSLAKLFNDIGDAQINLEDLRLEHGVGAQVGLAEISVLPSVVERLHHELADKGWRVHD